MLLLGLLVRLQVYNTHKLLPEGPEVSDGLFTAAFFL